MAPFWGASLVRPLTSMVTEKEGHNFESPHPHPRSLESINLINDIIPI